MAIIGDDNEDSDATIHNQNYLVNTVSFNDIIEERIQIV